MPRNHHLMPQKEITREPNKAKLFLKLQPPTPTPFQFHFGIQFNFSDFHNQPFLEGGGAGQRFALLGCFWLLMWPGGGSLGRRVYWKYTHTDLYLKNQSDPDPFQKGVLLSILEHTVYTISDPSSRPGKLEHLQRLFCRMCTGKRMFIIILLCIGDQKIQKLP